MSTISRLKRVVALALAGFVASVGVVSAPSSTISTATAAEHPVVRWTPKTDYGIWVYPATAKKDGQDTFVNKVVHALNATPAGATIRMSTHGSSDPEILGALFDAIDRKVNVQYITWHKDYIRDGKKHIDQLKVLLGENVRKDSFIKVCHGSCNVKGSKYIHHAKMILIDYVINTDGDRSKYLVFTGSSNASTGSSSRSWQHNELIVGQTKYYAAMAKYFKQMSLERTYHYAKPVRDGNTTVYFYPAKKPVNPQLELLRDVSSCTAKPGSGVNGRTKIDFMTFSWRKSLSSIATELVQLKKDGCAVRVAVAADQVESAIFKILKKGKVPTWNTRAKDQFNHAKLLAVSGTVNGRAANVIVSGSLNATAGAMKKNDEYLEETVDVRGTVLEAFDFFDNMADKSTRLWA